MPCPSGEEQTPPDGTCRQCQPGTFQATAASGQQTCRTCDSSTLQPLAGQTSCFACPSVGINCDNRVEVEVRPGFYLSEKAANRTATSGAATMEQSPLAVWRCAQHAACLGGTLSGDALCMDGHRGALCGRCEPGYYRGLVRCEPCESTDSEKRLGVFGSFTLAGSVVIVAVGMTIRYLWGSSRSCMSWRATVPQGRVAWLCAFVRLAIQRLPTGAALARIMVGYCQTVGVFRRLLRVRWPSGFLKYLEFLDQLALDMFRLVPAECIAGRLGFVVEVGAALSLPLLLLVIELVLAAIVAVPTSRWSPRRGFCALITTLFEWPELWDLVLWSLLLQVDIACCTLTCLRATRHSSAALTSRILLAFHGRSTLPLRASASAPSIAHHSRTTASFEWTQRSVAIALSGGWELP